MEALLGFSLDFWDYATFLSLFFLVCVGLGFVVFMLGLPGRIAIARNHPEAEAVYLMGWVGFLAVVPWVQALGWAFRPTTIIDVRYMPGGEADRNRRDDREADRQVPAGSHSNRKRSQESPRHDGRSSRSGICRRWCSGLFFSDSS